MNKAQNFISLQRKKLLRWELDLCVSLPEYMLFSSFSFLFLPQKSSVHQAVISKASLKPESLAETSVVNVQSDEAKLSRPSVKNLSMDDDMRAAYKPGLTSVSNLKSEEKSKKKKKKKSSIFSNYKKPGRKSSLGNPSLEVSILKLICFTPKICYKFR